MPFFRIHRRLAAWLAMWAMALSALAPAMAQAMVAASDDAQWMEVCSASGMVWLKVDEGNAAESSMGNGMPMGDMSKHCAWCSFHGTTALLAQTASGKIAAHGFSHALPVHVEWPPEGRPRAFVQARAPPLAS